MPFPSLARRSGGLPPALPKSCKKQFAKEMFSDILKTLWYTINREKQWTQQNKAFSLATKWRAGA